MEDKDRIIDDSIAVLDYIDKQFNDMQKIVSDSKEKLISYKENVTDSNEIVNCTRKQCTKFYINFIIQFQHLYSNFSNLLDVVYPFENKEKEIDKKLLKETSFIEADVNDGILYVKMPRLPLKIFRRLYVFQDELRLALEDLEIPHMSQKTMYILHVFKEGTSRYHIPDNDNYDFKRYTDIICDYIGSGDDVISTQFVLNSIYSNDIPEGSYIIIIPSKNIISIDDLTVNLKKITYIKMSPYF